MCAYQLRLTQRALDDLDLDRDLGWLPADEYQDQHEVVRGFVALRGQNPRGQETTVLPVTKATVWNLHVGRYRGLTWFDKRHSVVWLLGVGWHEQGSRDDAYEVLKARDSTGDLFPKAADYRCLVPSSERFARDLLVAPVEAIRCALDNPGEEIIRTIGGVLEVSVLAECVQVSDHSMCEIFLSLHMPPQVMGVLPSGWEMTVLAAFAPGVDGADMKFQPRFPRRGPPPAGVHSETVYSYVVETPGWP